MQTPIPEISDKFLDLADKWILSRLHSTIGEVNGLLDRFEINQATKVLYDFIWHDFCDWYVEMLKGRLYGSESTQIKTEVLVRALEVFDQALRLLHPFMPFVTEELWQRLAPRGKGESIMMAAFPAADEKSVDKSIEQEMGLLQQIVESIRAIRSDYNLRSSLKLKVCIFGKHDHAIFQEQSERGDYGRYIRLLCNVELTSGTDFAKPPYSATTVVGEFEIHIDLEGVINIPAEKARLDKEIKHTEDMLQSIGAKLANSNFRQKASKDVILNEEAKYNSFHSKLEKLKRNYEDLSS